MKPNAILKKTGEKVFVVYYDKRGIDVTWVDKKGDVHTEPLNYYKDFKELDEYDWNEFKRKAAIAAMQSFISRPNHGYTYEEIAIMSRRYAEEVTKQMKGVKAKDGQE